MVLRDGREPRQVGLIPGLELRQDRVGEVAREVGLDPRQVPEVLRLAVALVEAGEDAEHLGGALRAHDGVGACERRDVESGVRRLALARIEADELQFEIRPAP